jgi:hypothetical protein
LTTTCSDISATFQKGPGEAVTQRQGRSRKVIERTTVRLNHAHHRYPSGDCLAWCHCADSGGLIPSFSHENSRATREEDMPLSGFSYPVGQAPATQTNDNAAAGKVGEIISATLVNGSAVSIMSGGPATITSIALTPGDWDVDGAVYFQCAASTNFTFAASSISAADNTLDVTPGSCGTVNYGSGVVLGSSSSFSTASGPVRISLSGNATYYLIAFATFTVSTASAWGTIRARRVR